jgi:hypothetical protein
MNPDCNTVFHPSNRQVETSSSSSENCKFLKKNNTRCRIKSSYFPHEDDEAISAVRDMEKATGNVNIDDDDDDDDDEQTKFLTFPTFRSVVTNGSSSNGNMNNTAADTQLHPIPITTTPRPPTDTSLSNIPTSINKSNVFDSRSPPLPTALHELLGLSQAIHTMSQKSSPLQGATETKTILSTPACYPTTMNTSNNNSTASCPLMDVSTNTTDPSCDKATVIDADSKDSRQHICSGKFHESFPLYDFIPTTNKSSHRQPSAFHRLILPQ